MTIYTSTTDLLISVDTWNPWFLMYLVKNISLYEYLEDPLELFPVSM